eukprot:jgi/Orpsp1_1/1181488/evm.model.c7180000077354.1
MNELETKSEIDEPLLNPNPKIEHHPKPRKERIYWIDCLRVFASFLVVYIHVTGVDLAPMNFKSYNWKALFFLNSLPRPCVPLFIMISGIFFLNPEKPLTINKLYTKSISRIFKSYCFWTLYYNIFDTYVINWGGWQYVFSKELVKNTFRNIVLGGNHLWYLNFIMGLYMATPIFRAACADRTNAWYTFWLCTVISQIIPTICDLVEYLTSFNINLLRDFTNYLRLYPAWGFTSYYILGYLLASKEFTNKSIVYITYLIGFFGIGITVVLRFASSYHLGFETNIFGEYNCFNVAMGTLGIFTFFQYSVNKWIRPLMRIELFRKILFTLSDCSFGIYLIHMTVYHFSFRFLKFHPQSFDPLFCAPLFSIFVFIVAFGIIYIMRKFSFFRIIT